MCPVKYGVVFATPGLHSPSVFLIARRAQREVQPVELHVVLRQLADRRLALVQPAELRADVGGAGAIAILWNENVSLDFNVRRLRG